MATHRNGNVELFYELAGTTGDPVALIHGSLADHGTWSGIAGPLANGLQVLTYDRRGYGRSAGPRREHAVRDDAADLASLLEGTELYPAHLVAHSYAGGVALRLAAERPELVRSLVLHEPPFIGYLRNDPEWAEQARAWPGWIERLRTKVADGEPETAARELLDVFSVRGGAWERSPIEVRRSATATIGMWVDEYSDPEAIDPDLPSRDEIWVPVLLTSGERSPPWLRRIVDRLATSLKNASTHVVRDAGHAPQLTAPDQYVGILTTFLSERIVPTV